MACTWIAFFIGAAAQLRAEADLAVLSSWPTGAYPVEHAVNFTLTVTNQGPDPASGVVLTNLLPATFVLNSVFASQGTWSSNGSVISCDLGELTNQQTATVSLMVTPMVTGLATNQTLLSTSSTDTNLVNNTVSKTVSVRPPYCYFYGTNVLEGDAGFTNADITVQLEFPISLTVSMSFNTGGDSATAGVDYVATNGVLIIPPGVTNQTISISVIGDRLYEGGAKLAGEWFNGYFGSPTNAAFSQQRGFAVCNIMDDDPKPTLTVSDIAVVEGQSGTTQAVFTVSLSAASGVTTTFQWATANGTATAGQDYGAASSSSATIAAGQTNRTVNISVYGDTALECDEFFLLNLLNPVNATLARTQAVCTIFSDELSLHLPARINENNGLVSGAGEIIIGCGNVAGLVVTLSNPAPELVSMPASVILPPGESNALFDLQTIDDSLLNGSRPVTITASAPLHASTSANLVVDDNESSSLSLVVPTVVEEGTAGITGQVHVAKAPDVNTTVGLSSSDTSSVQTPQSVVIPAGQTSASFTLVAPNDFQLAGTKTVTLTAHVQNWSDGLATMAVTDLTNLSLTLPAELVEGQWATGVVQTTATAITNLPIALQVSDANVLSIPATVEIPAGALSANFVFQAVDNAVCLGDRSIQVAASSALLRSATNILTVLENDPDHFTLSKVPVSQEAHAYYYNLILTACDPLGLPLRAYNRSATLSAAGMAGPVDVLPATTAAFVQGVCTQYYYFHSWDNNVHLSVTDGQGHAGQSNPFNIVRPFHHKLDLSVNDLAWDPVRGRIIASVANYWNAISNTLAFINPTNGRVESTLDIGPSPGRMAISDDAHYLYVSFQATNLIRRLDLASRTVDLEFSLGEYVLLPGITYPLYADDMQVQPGNPEVLAVSRMRPTVSPRAAGIAVYNHGVMRASVYGYPPSFGPNYIEFGGAPTRLYGYDTQVSSFTFHRMNVTEAGVVGESTAGLMQGYGLDFAYGGGRIYVSNGQIYNPETGGLIGTLPNSVAPVPAPDINKIICIRQNGSYPDLLQIFDASALWLLHQDYIPGASGTAASALRWGDGGVAFRTTASQVYILQSGYLADLDGDGVPDPWENEKLGSVSAADRLPDADPDHDGLSNRAEYVMGTNPLDASSTLRIAAVRKDGNDLQISIPSVVGRCYQVERCSGLGNNDWTVVDALPGTGDILQLNDPGAASAPVTFYRAKVFF